MHRFRTLTKLAYSAARPLQHLFSTFLAPCPFSSSRARSAIADQYANSLSCLCALVAGSATMAYVAVAQAFAFFSICVSIVAMTEKKGLFVPNA